MSIKCKYISLHEIGKRANQEDSLYPALGQDIPDNDLFILCDGMGGHDCGEVASQTVCDAMSSYIKSNPSADFESALNAAYDALDNADNSSLKKMGTTMTFVKFDENTCVVAHIGDSRVYHIRPSEKRVLYVTRDHSLVNDLLACGELTPEEAKNSTRKNVITRAMQPHQGKRTKADVAIISDIREGDYFYMCSDGMLEISEDEDIVNVLSMEVSDEEKIEILRGVTKDNSDNHTAHLIRICSVEKARKSRKSMIIALFVALLSVACFFWIRSVRSECESLRDFWMMFRDSTANQNDSLAADDLSLSEETIIIDNADM